jgi:hypothetical protein
MPKLVPNSSLSPDAVSMSNHLDECLRQKTPRSKIYAKDMVVHHVLADGRDVIGVHRDGTSSMFIFHIDSFEK